MIEQQHLYRVLRHALLIMVVLFLVASSINAYVPVIFRYDDYCASDDQQRMLVDSRILEIHNRHSVPVVLGVIPMKNPDCENPTAPLIEDEKRMVLLKESMAEGFVEVALHGYNHARLAQEGQSGEFSGLPLDEQRRRISLGKEALESWLGIEVDVFIPPFNTYDDTTLEILNEVGFRIISAGMYTGPEPTHLISIPYWVLLYPMDLNLLLQEAEKSNSFPPIVVLLHEYDFFESNDSRAVISLDDYERIVSFVASSKNLQGTTFSQLADDQDLLDRFRSATTRVFLLEYNLRRFVPGPFRNGFQRVFFFLKRSIGFAGLLIVLYILLFLAGLAVSLFISRLLGNYRSLWTGISLVMFALSAYLVVRVGPFDISLLAGSARYMMFSVILATLIGSIVGGVRFSRSKVRRAVEIRS